jgi:hypothetical protein
VVLTDSRAITVSPLNQGDAFGWNTVVFSSFSLALSIESMIASTALWKSDGRVLLTSAHPVWSCALVESFNKGSGKSSFMFRWKVSAQAPQRLSSKRNFREVGGGFWDGSDRISQVTGTWSDLMIRSSCTDQLEMREVSIALSLAHVRSRTEVCLARKKVISPFWFRREKPHFSIQSIRSSDLGEVGGALTSTDHASWWRLKSPVINVGTSGRSADIRTSRVLDLASLYMFTIRNVIDGESVNSRTRMSLCLMRSARWLTRKSGLALDTYAETLELVLVSSVLGTPVNWCHVLCCGSP